MCVRERESVKSADIKVVTIVASHPESENVASALSLL